MMLFSNLSLKLQWWGHRSGVLPVFVDVQMHMLTMDLFKHLICVKASLLRLLSLRCLITKLDSWCYLGVGLRVKGELWGDWVFCLSLVVKLIYSLPIVKAWCNNSCILWVLQALSNFLRVRNDYVFLWLRLSMELGRSAFHPNGLVKIIYCWIVMEPPFIYSLDVSLLLFNLYGIQGLLLDVAIVRN